MKGGSAMYDKELMDHLVKLHLEQGRTYKSLEDEFGINSSTISRAVKRLRKEAEADAQKAKTLADMEEILRLQKEVQELKKENDFLKKAAAFFAKESN